MAISKLNAQERVRAAAALRANAAAASPTSPGLAPRQPDAVSISDKARSLAAARKAVSKSPEVREDRITALKAALASGTYTIDSHQLAQDIASKADA